jgi:hypothetical protein
MLGHASGADTTLIVMPDPGIHVFVPAGKEDVDHRDKPGDDGTNGCLKR